MIQMWLPIVTKSPNIVEHWGKNLKRKRAQKYWILYLFSLHKDSIPSFPCSVYLTRTGPKQLDFDNMVMSLKTVRDAIAAQLTGDHVPGHADSDPRISWHYDQKKGKLGVNIRIEENGSKA